MKTQIVIWTLVLGLAGVVSVAVDAAKAPKDTTIKACAKSKPAVAFPHAKHVAGKVACKSCHHKGAENKNCTAAGCHGAKAEGKKASCAEASLTKNVFHISCVGCHKKEGKGPKGCPQCHKK